MRENGYCLLLPPPLCLFVCYLSHRNKHATAYSRLNRRWKSKRQQAYSRRWKSKKAVRRDQDADVRDRLDHGPKVQRFKSVAMKWAQQRKWGPVFTPRAALAGQSDQQQLRLELVLLLALGGRH